MKNDKMPPQESESFMKAVCESHNGIMVDRATATRIDPSVGLDVRHTFGFAEDCEESFQQIESMRETIDRMLNWRCVFGEEETRRIRAAHQHLDDLEGAIRGIYKYIEK